MLDRRRAGFFYRPQVRFACLAGPGALFIVIALLLPLLSIVVFSFWRTESYELYADWNLENYRAEFNKIINKEGFDALLKRMKKKLDEKEE